MKKHSSLTMLGLALAVLFLATIGCCGWLQMDSGLESNNNVGNGRQTNNNRVNTGPSPTETANAATNGTRPPGTPAPPEPAPQDEAKFPFPPPRSTDFEKKDLGDQPPQQFIARLNEQLAAAGYGSSRRLFFARNNEFAVVTAMERIDDDGQPLKDARRFDLGLPGASGVREYFDFLLRGKRANFRTFVFFITQQATFHAKRGPEPNFETAKNWMESRELGDPRSAPAEIERAPDGAVVNPFYCYAMVYVFEKHTSQNAETFLRDFKVSAAAQLAAIGVGL